MCEIGGVFKKFVKNEYKKVSEREREASACCRLWSGGLMMMMYHNNKISMCAYREKKITSIFLQSSLKVSLRHLLYNPAITLTTTT